MVLPTFTAASAITAEFCSGKIESSGTAACRAAASTRRMRFANRHPWSGTVLRVAMIAQPSRIPQQYLADGRSKGQPARLQPAAGAGKARSSACAPSIYLPAVRIAPGATHMPSVRILYTRVVRFAPRQWRRLAPNTLCNSRRGQPQRFIWRRARKPLNRGRKIAASVPTASALGRPRR